MTLHEEIKKILEESNKALSTIQIANLVNQRKNYKKKDGSNVTDFQIHGRTKNYPQLFSRSGNLVDLIKNAQNNQRAKTLNSPTKLIASSEAIKKDNINFDSEDVTKMKFLKSYKFTKLNPLRLLLQYGLPADPKLDSCGIYAITITNGYKFEIISEETTRKNNNVVKPWSNEKLENKWVNNVDVVYYGLAGDSSPRFLRDRLNDLLNHGNGKTTSSGPHKGGEILWQLKGYENFNLWILPTDNPPSPRNFEKAFLKRFYEIVNKLPFANRQF